MHCRMYNTITVSLTLPVNVECRYEIYLCSLLVVMLKLLSYAESTMY